MRLLTYNIREGGTGRVALLAEVIDAARADVVALQEARDPDVVERLAAMLGYPHWGSRAAHSTGFLSRIPVVAHAWRHPPRTRHAMLEVTLGDGLPRLFVVHLRAWFSRWNEQVRVRELGGLLDGIKAQLAREGESFAWHILTGDFNALAPDEAFDPSSMPRWIRGMVWMSGREFPRSTVALMRSEGYVDAWRALHASLSEAPGYTFPVWGPHVRLDYVFVPTAFATRLTHCEVLRAPGAVATASDHLPLLAELAD